MQLGDLLAGEIVGFGIRVDFGMPQNLVTGGGVALETEDKKPAGHELHPPKHVSNTSDHSLVQQPRLNRD